MVGLLQGVAFSHNILVFCNSLDLAQGEPAMVAIVANQCPRLRDYCLDPLYPELPELGINEPVDWTPERANGTIPGVENCKEPKNGVIFRKT
jgi:hypothetical protein